MQTFVLKSQEDLSTGKRVQMPKILKKKRIQMKQNQEYAVSVSQLHGVITMPSYGNLRVV